MLHYDYFQLCVSRGKKINGTTPHSASVKTSPATPPRFIRILMETKIWREKTTPLPAQLSVPLL